MHRIWTWKGITNISTTFGYLCPQKRNGVSDGAFLETLFFQAPLERPSLTGNPFSPGHSTDTP